MSEKKNTSRWGAHRVDTVYKSFKSCRPIKEAVTQQVRQKKEKDYRDPYINEKRLAEKSKRDQRTLYYDQFTVYQTRSTSNKRRDPYTCEKRPVKENWFFSMKPLCWRAMPYKQGDRTSDSTNVSKETSTPVKRDFFLDVQYLQTIVPSIALLIRHSHLRLDKRDISLDVQHLDKSDFSLDVQYQLIIVPWTQKIRQKRLLNMWKETRKRDLLTVSNRLTKIERLSHDKYVRRDPHTYGVATSSRLLQIIRLFCRI